MFKTASKTIPMDNSILAITGVNVIDVQNRLLLEDATILCQDGKILSLGSSSSINIPNDAHVVEYQGHYVIPGLVDAHVHLAHPGIDDYGRISLESITQKYIRNSRLTLKSGVTTIRNMPGSFGYSILKYRDEVNTGKYNGPRIIASGPALSAPFGYFSLKRFIPVPQSILPILSVIFGAHGLSIDVDSPEEVADAVSKLKDAGVDFIKTSTPGASMQLIENDTEARNYYLQKKVDPRLLDAQMRPEILKEIVKQAHAKNLKVSTHSICFPNDIKQAVELGVDSIEHTPLGLITDETFQKMSASNTYWIPTAYCFYHWYQLMNNPNYFDRDEIMEAIPKKYQVIGKKMLLKQKTAIDSGADPHWAKFYNEMKNYHSSYFPDNFNNAMRNNVKIVAGTDAGMGGAGYVPHGFIHKELEIFAKHGMDGYDVLRTATLNAAELLNMKDLIGSLEVGKYADMVILKENPLENMSALRETTCVLKEGKIVYRTN